MYVYREGGTLGGGNTWDLYANGRNITNIANGGYYDFVADPGRIEFGALIGADAVMLVPKLLMRGAGPQPVCSVQAEPDHTYYFKFEIGAKMSQVTRDQAVRAMAGTRRFADAKPADAKPGK